MTDENVNLPDTEPVEIDTAPAAEPVPVTQHPAVAPEPVPHPTGVILDASEIQGPTGAVTEEPDIDEDYDEEVSAPETYPMDEQIEPDDVENGGAA